MPCILPQEQCDLSTLTCQWFAIVNIYIPLFQSTIWLLYILKGTCAPHFFHGN